MDIIGKRYGRLVVTGITSDERYRKYASCTCDCGNSHQCSVSHLKSGHTQSCGCLAREYKEAELQLAALERRSYTKSSYKAMMARCHYPKAPGYFKYGGVGITVCDRWRFGEGGMSGWDCFYEDMGPRPQGYSIDRLDNTRGYDTDNCRWATQKQQHANRRPRGSITK